MNIRPLSPTDIELELPVLISLLKDSVDAGASIGFLQPLGIVEAREYWTSIALEIVSGSRLLLGAFLQERVVGTGQLSFPRWPNARHRADLQKLFVDSQLRGQGIGRLLVAALHETALEHGRTLLVLHTQGDDSVQTFYKRVGYRRAGVIPDFARDGAGRKYDDVTYYVHLEPPH